MLILKEKRVNAQAALTQVYGRKNTYPIEKSQNYLRISTSFLPLFAGFFQKPQKKVSRIRQVILAAGLAAIPLNPGPSPVPASSILASWYDCVRPGECSRHKITASGERFNPRALTAAHRSLPFGTRVRVTHGKRSVTVRINDRGPFIRGRSLDLSRAAARAIGCGGVCRVRMTVVRRVR